MIDLYVNNDLSFCLFIKKITVTNRIDKKKKQENWCNMQISHVMYPQANIHMVMHIQSTTSKWDPHINHMSLFPISKKNPHDPTLLDSPLKPPTSI
jgi:hypothetical protein